MPNLSISDNIQVYAAENLLKMITELKHSILVNDFETINDSVYSQVEKFRNHEAKVKPQLSVLNAQISEVIKTKNSLHYIRHLLNWRRNTILPITKPKVPLR